MLELFTHDHVSELLSALGGLYRARLCDGLVHTVSRDLPGDAVAAVCPTQDGKLLVVYDLRKPDALGHARDLVCQWWTSVVEPVAYPDGTVELMERPLPHVDVQPLECTVVALV